MAAKLLHRWGVSSHRLRSTLYHSIPKPSSRPPPLWQIATALDTAAEPAETGVRRPATSAVTAGWICIGIGLLTAWFFPLAHVFFSIAILLSVVAMATHQVRGGLLLLAGSLASIGVCVILFIGLVAGALHAATKTRPELASFPQPAPTVHRAVPVASTSRPVAQEGTVRGNAPGSSSVRPATPEEVLGLLAEGRQEGEILAAVAGRPFSRQIGPAEITSLRAYGASEGLIDRLRAPSMFGNGQGASTYTAPIATFPTRMEITAPPLPATQPAARPLPMATPADHAARDRQIADLQKRVEQIDETIRRVRADPQGNRWIKGAADSSRQQSSDAYLDQLDKQRNDLRRQKWALEGR